MVVRMYYLSIILAFICLMLLTETTARTFYREKNKPKFRKSNICSVVNKKPRCCIGWNLDESNLHCSIPVCTGDCEGVGGRCINPDTCLCPGGYVAFSCYVGKLADTRSICSIRCKNSGTCSGDKCICKPGFSGTRCEIAECPNDCSGQGVCKSNGECACNDGFSGLDCSEEPKEPCFREVYRGLCRNPIFGMKATKQVCCNSIGSAWGNPCKKCSDVKCDKGYANNLKTRRCEDINECRVITGMCAGGICQNTEGGFKCICPTGTSYDKNKMICSSEYDVCRRNPRRCGPGRCLTTGNGFRCKCYNGYKLSADGKRCEKTPAYLQFDMCHYNKGYLCANGQCIPQGRSYKCRCDSGYQPSSDGRSCEKQVDFCSFYGDRVCLNGVCQAVGNSDYRCKCKEGYEPSADHKKCISTCERYGDSLCPNGRCVPAGARGYECQCDKGYYQSLNRKMCVRNNNVVRTVCDYYNLCTNGRCVPTGKSYQCECNSGYERTTDGKACREIPKKSRSHVCDLYPDYYCANAKCIPIGSNYRCECNPGFEKGGSNGWCRAKSRLRSSKGDSVSSSRSSSSSSSSWSSSSSSSSKSLGTAASVRSRSSVSTRKDEKNYCTTYTYLCENGKCIPTTNYFYCVCNPGYIQVDDKRRCRKVEKQPAKLQSGFYDFCQHYRSQCRGGTCHNEPTNYWCSCLPGYRWDERRLQCLLDNRRRLVSDQWNAYAKRRQKPTNWRRNSRWYFSACEQMGRDVCGKGYCVDKSSSFECRCYEGYQSTQHNKRCVDINECDLRPNVCWQGKCVNTPGSYSCQCLKGFILSHVNKEPICVDRNECEEGSPCINGACRNSWGSYKCVCYEGYVNDKTGKLCLPGNSANVVDKLQLPKPMNKTETKDKGWRADEMLSDNPSEVKNCTVCQYGCDPKSKERNVCKCPPGLVTLGNSDLCVEDKSVLQYTFEIEMDGEENEKRRKKRSIPDKVAASHRLARIVLKKGVDVDHFINTMAGRYKKTNFYQVVRLGDVEFKGNGTHTIIDVVFT